MVGVAVTIMGVPRQTAFADAIMETAAGRVGVTIIVLAFDVAGLLVTQVKLEVSTQVITSLFAGIYE